MCFNVDIFSFMAYSFGRVIIQIILRPQDVQNGKDRRLVKGVLEIRSYVAVMSVGSRASSIYIGADNAVSKGIKDGQKEWIKEHGDQASD